MSRIKRVLIPAVFIIAPCGVAASSAFAVEAPFYKLNKAGRLKAGETRELGLKGSSATYVIKTSILTITCTSLATKKGSTINGSEPGEAGTSSVVLEKSNCTQTGNGKCIVTSVAGAGDKKIVTTTLKDELELAAETPVKGTKILDLFTPVSGTLIADILFDPGSVGEKCKFGEDSLEGSVDAEILNSKKETVAFEEHEAEETSMFIKALPNGSKACKLKAGKLDKCVTSSLKGLGVAATAEGTDEIFLTGGDAGKVFGVFAK